MYKVSTKPVKKIPIDKITQIYKRRYELRDVKQLLLIFLDWFRNNSGR